MGRENFGRRDLFRYLQLLTATSIKGLTAVDGGKAKMNYGRQLGQSDTPEDDGENCKGFINALNNGGDHVQDVCPG